MIEFIFQNGPLMGAVFIACWSLALVFLAFYVIVGIGWLAAAWNTLRK